jgi:hypothetical protein
MTSHRKAKENHPDGWFSFGLPQQFRTFLVNAIYRDIAFNCITFQRIANNISLNPYSLNISLYCHISSTVNITRKISTAGNGTACITASRKGACDRDISTTIATARQMTANNDLCPRITSSGNNAGNIDTLSRFTT